MDITPSLPIHPTTGLRALGILARSGRPIWPVMGGNGQGAGQAGTGGQGGNGQAGSGGDGGQGGGGTGGAGDGGQSGQQTFSQADVDRIIGERLAREREKYADYDDLKAKATEYDQLKEAQATEQEKALNKARKEAEDAVRQQLEPQMHRLMAALKHGLPEELGNRVLQAAKRLVGSTPEEFEADAKEFFAASPITAPAGGAGNGTGGGFAQGVRGGGSAPKAGLASGADLYRERHGKKTT